jgi:exopolysaccharide production protein ExoZ
MKNAQQEVKTKRLRTFDFLRGLAILGVIAVHTSQIFPSQISAIDFMASLGRFGVQLFYFISALTMCYMWEIREGEKNPVKNFYIRRFFRIAPLFWIAIPVYLLINGFEKNYWAPDGIGALEIFLTATFLHGFWPNSINSVVPGGWSIAVEMTFYALFPLFILKIKSRIFWIILAFATWIFNIFIFKDFSSNLFSNLPYDINTTIIEEYLYLNFINQAPIFLLGCYIYSILNNKPKKVEIFILCAWILFAAVLQFFHNVRGFGFLAVYTLIGIFVYGCIKMNVRFNYIEKIGKQSYAIYLTHFLVLHYLKIIIPYKLGLPSLLIGIMLTIFISYVLALIIFRFIESKVQYFVDRITKPKITQQRLEA